MEDRSANHRAAERSDAADEDDQQGVHRVAHSGDLRADDGLVERIHRARQGFHDGAAARAATDQAAVEDPVCRQRAAGGVLGYERAARLQRERVALRLTADTFRCEAGCSKPLARLVHERTGGNPFLATQFLTELADEGLVAFDGRTASWRWDLDSIRSKGFADNVADLMARKLIRLPEAVREELALLACLGDKARIATLALVKHEAEEKIRQDLEEALRSGLIYGQDDHVSFLHDRVREAAYSLIPDEQRGAVHLRIGRTLLSLALPHRHQL